ncbi:MAG: hypothetical protein BGO09_13495 [Bacteroidetes bacterium 47-18]|nr:MAG: hypothetical protein BGO09_13495 [Bacteroidetes bacterium 47-18]
MPQSDFKITFYTATILEWKPLLVKDVYKQIVVDSLRHLVSTGKIKVYGFVVMPNHIHLVWQILDTHTALIQQSFMRYTAQMMLRNLREDPDTLAQYYVGARDRKYQVWERNPLHVFIEHRAVFLQKLNYIHDNPVRKQLVTYPADYKYSTAAMYLKNTADWDFVTVIDH